MIAALFDLEPTAPLEPDQPADEWRSDRVPSDLEMLTGAVARDRATTGEVRAGGGQPRAPASCGSHAGHATRRSTSRSR